MCSQFIHYLRVFTVATPNNGATVNFLKNPLFIFFLSTRIFLLEKPPNLLQECLRAYSPYTAFYNTQIPGQFFLIQSLFSNETL